VFCEAFGVIVSDHKTNYLLVGLDEPPSWIIVVWNLIPPSIIFRYPRILFGMGFSLVAVSDWYM
jgi:hypothetical protein